MIYSDNCFRFNFYDTKLTSDMVYCSIICYRDVFSPFVLFK